MTACHLRGALLLATVVPFAAATAAAALKAGCWELTATRHEARLSPKPRPRCPDCRGEGGWWVNGPNPEMEACGCWSDRREIRIRLLPVPGWDEPPF